MEPIEEHRRLVERFLDAYNAFDVEGMLALLHPDGEFRNGSGGAVPASARAIEDFRARPARAATLFASRRQTPTAWAADGDDVRVEIDYEGVLAADLGPELRAGDVLRLAGRSTFGYRDGRIARLVDES